MENTDIDTILKSCPPLNSSRNADDHRTEKNVTQRLVVNSFVSLRHGMGWHHSETREPLTSLQVLHFDFSIESFREESVNRVTLTSTNVNMPVDCLLATALILHV